MASDAQRHRGSQWSDGTLRAVKSLSTFQPYTGSRWPLGLQAGLSMAVPIAVGGLIDQQGLGLLAATGGFTALHVTNLNVRERMRVLPLIASFLLASSVLATVLAPYPAAASVGLVLVTIVGAALAFGYRTGPPGPLFVALAYGLAAHVTGVVGGERITSPASLVSAVAAGTVFALALAAFPLVRPANRAQTSRRLRDILPRYSLGRQGSELLVRVILVTILGAAISVLIVDPDRAYWTVGAGIAVIGVRAGRSDAAQRGLHRVVGTIAGAIVYLGLGALDLMPLPMALALGFLQFMVQITVVRHYALALLFITPLVLLLTGTATGGGTSIETLYERFIDTAIGATLGTLSGLLHRPASKGGSRA